MQTNFLRKLAGDFASNRFGAAKAIREMFIKDPQGFPPAVADVLRSEPDSPGAQFLLAMLLAEPKVFATLCNPDLYSLDQSLSLIRKARKLDTRTEVRLAQLLADGSFVDEAETRFATRVLEVLAASPDPSTALPPLRQLMNSPNARVRSKAALLIGQINRNPQWATSRVTETDARVFANSVESLWGVNSSAAREVFHKASHHSNHRAAANGMVGLYLAGDPESFALLLCLSRTEIPLSRSAAAWAMGRIEDPRFLPALASLLEDADGLVRKSAFRALACIRQHASQMKAAGILRVKIHEAAYVDGAQRVRVGVDRDSAWISGLDERQFVVWNGPDLVERFSAKEIRDPNAIYEIAYNCRPSSSLVTKVQVYSRSGVGEASSLPSNG